MHCRARTAILLAAFWLGAASNVQSQVSTRVDSLNRALSALSARIDSLEAGLCPAAAGPAVPGPSGNRTTDTLAAAGPVTGAEACRAAPGALCAGCDTRGGTDSDSGFHRRSCGDPGRRGAGSGAGRRRRTNGLDQAETGGAASSPAEPSGSQSPQPRDQRDG